MCRFSDSLNKRASSVSQSAASRACGSSLSIRASSMIRVRVGPKARRRLRRRHSPCPEPHRGRQSGRPSWATSAFLCGVRRSVNKSGTRRCLIYKSLWRRERDSNPRWAFDPYSLSRGAPSTTRPSLQNWSQRIRGPGPNGKSVSALLSRIPVDFPTKEAGRRGALPGRTA